MTKKRINELREVEKKAQQSLALEIKNLKDEAGMGDLILMSYDQLADGSRAKKVNRKIEPEQEKAILRWLNN